MNTARNVMTGPDHTCPDHMASVSLYLMDLFTAFQDGWQPPSPDVLATFHFEQALGPADHALYGPPVVAIAAR